MLDLWCVIMLYFLKFFLYFFFFFFFFWGGGGGGGWFSCLLVFSKLTVSKNSGIRPEWQKVLIQIRPDTETMQRHKQIRCNIFQGSAHLCLHTYTLVFDDTCVTNYICMLSIICIVSQLVGINLNLSAKKKNLYNFHAPCYVLLGIVLIGKKIK